MILNQLKKISYLLLTLGMLTISPLKGTIILSVIKPTAPYAAIASAGAIAIALTKAIDCLANKKPFTQEMKNTLKLIFTNPTQLLKNGKGDQAVAALTLLTGIGFIGYATNSAFRKPMKKSEAAILPAPKTTAQRSEEDRKYFACFCEDINQINTPSEDRERFFKLPQTKQFLVYRAMVDDKQITLAAAIT